MSNADGLGLSSDAGNDQRIDGIRPLIYRSVCSGIEAPSVAWRGLGWTAQSFSEIDPFCCALLKHYYPEVPNHGDFTKAEDNSPVDILVGGTPCQSFSVAGQRGGLRDTRGNLALEFLKLAQRCRVRWILFENVPGLLSSDGGRDFGTFLEAMVQCGYGFAYRIMDAQFSGLAQRRQRLWVVGYLGDWRPPATVLFESESLQRNSPPSRTKGQGTTYDVAPCVGASGRGFERTGDTRGQDCVVAHALNAGGTQRIDYESETFVTCPLTGNPYGDDAARESLLVAHTLKSEGADASEDGTGRGVPLVAVPIMVEQNSQCSTPDLPNIRSVFPNYAVSVPSMAVRRLTPRECERLMGFPDDYTLIPYRKKLAKDGPRYRAIGNSMAVTELRWLGQRIQFVDRLLQSANAAKSLTVSTPEKSANA